MIQVMVTMNDPAFSSVKLQKENNITVYYWEEQHASCLVAKQAVEFPQVLTS